MAMKESRKAGVLSGTDVASPAMMPIATASAFSTTAIAKATASSSALRFGTMLGLSPNPSQVCSGTSTVGSVSEEPRNMAPTALRSAIRCAAPSRSAAAAAKSCSLRWRWP